MDTTSAPQSVLVAIGTRCPTQHISLPTSASLGGAARGASRAPELPIAGPDSGGVTRHAHTSVTPAHRYRGKPGVAGSSHLEQWAVVEIGILGPLEVRADGRVVQITGARLRALLTRLAVEAPTTVSTAELVDALWPGDPPNDPVNALQSLISRVRRLLGDTAAVQQVVGGYRLAVEREAVDAAAFSALVAAGRRELRDGADATARDTLAKALSLWRGPPLVDAGDAGYAAAPRVRLQDQLLGARTDMIEAELRLGRGVDVIGDLESLVAANPLRERLAGQLMRALAAAGRTADALAVFDRLRAHLADELGVDPGPEVQALQLAVLRGEIEPEVMTTPPSGRRHSNLRASLTSFIGREDELARVSTLLESGRLVTIVGPGGAGKTRLASEVAARWISRRSDGVWLIELAPVSDGKAIAQAMLGALGLLDTRSVDRRLGRAAPESMEQLFDVLAEADCLLLVDNCEHLIGPVAALVDQLLARCPEVRILTTSREPLGIVVSPCRVAAARPAAGRRCRSRRRRSSRRAAADRACAGGPCRVRGRRLDRRRHRRDRAAVGRPSAGDRAGRRTAAGDADR